MNRTINLKRTIGSALLGGAILLTGCSESAVSTAIPTASITPTTMDSAHTAQLAKPEPTKAKNQRNNPALRRDLDDSRPYDLAPTEVTKPEPTKAENQRNSPALRRDLDDAKPYDPAFTDTKVTPTATVWCRPC